MTMPHITAQMRSKMLTHDDGRARISKMMAEIPDSIGNGCLRTNEQQQVNLAVVEASSPSTVLGQTPSKQKFNAFLTPKSITSAVFDIPNKQSPSSSLSSSDDSQLFTAIKRDPTPVAELEDTSQKALFRSELEDTSGLAMSSYDRKSLRPACKSSYPTSQALVAAVDRQLADYEEEIRQLRRDFVQKEKSAIAAQKATAKAQDALLIAKKAIIEREAVIEQLVRLNSELGQEVVHCQKHHLPPPTPSKSKVLEIPISLFNPDASRSSLSATTPNTPPVPYSGDLLKNSLRKCSKPPPPSANKHFNSTQAPTSLAVTSRCSGPGQTNWKPFSAPSNNSSPKSIAAAASPVAKSPSAAGSPYARPLNPTYNFTPPNVYIPLTAEALSAATSSSSTLPNSTNLSEKCCFTPLGFTPLSESIKSNTANETDSQRRPKSKNGRPGHIRSHSSTPSLRLRGPLSPYNYIPHAPPVPPVMSGGLPAPLSPPTGDVQVVNQGHKLRKMLNELGNGLSDVFLA